MFSARDAKSRFLEKSSGAAAMVRQQCIQQPIRPAVLGSIGRNNGMHLQEQTASRVGRKTPSRSSVGLCASCWSSPTGQKDGPPGLDPLRSMVKGRMDMRVS